MRAAVLAMALLMGGAIPALAEANPDAVMGIWWTQDHDGVVQIYRCQAGLCGRVVGVVTFRPDGSAPVDIHGRSRCHLEIIPGGRVEDDGVWASHIINPDDGKTWTINLQAEPDGRLRMRGYIGLPLFGETVHWTHFTGHLTPDCHVEG